MVETAGSAIAAHEVARDRGLRRGIGAFGLAAAIVNIVVGAGIFSLPGNMAKVAGPYSLLAYLACAVAMGAVVLCCAEAGSRVPASGGIAAYVDAAFGPRLGFIASVLLWLSCVLANGGIAAAFAGALVRFAPGLDGFGPRAAVIVAVLGLLSLVNLLSVKTATRLIAWATAVKLIPLLLFVGVGLFFIEPARVGAGAAPNAAGIGRAVLLSLFAFQGMETVLAANGEVDRPTRTLPLGLISAMAFVAVLYVAIQLVAQGLLGGALAGLQDPLADAIGRVDPRLVWVILVGAAVSRFAWLGSDILGAPRVLFALAREGFLPSVLGKLTRKSQVPGVAIVVHAAIGAALAVSGTFEQLAALSVLPACLLYIGACAAAWRLDRRGVAVMGSPLKLPGLGILAVVGGLSMAAVIALAQPVEIGALVAAVAVSWIIYEAAVRFRRARFTPPGS